MSTNSSTNGPKAPARETTETGKPENDALAVAGKTAAPAPRPLPEAARRALAEAEERRRMAETEAREKEAELGGRGGLDPARYGDWEIKGRAIDF